MRTHAFAVLTLIAAPAALAQVDSFHLMQIEQVVGGVGGNLTKQAVQLRMRFFGQGFVSESRLRVWDAEGQNPIVVMAFPGDVQNMEDGDRVLIASSGFVTPVPADFVMDNRIPESYLPAGRLTFEDHFGTILWSLAWGGKFYTGPTTGSFNNSPTGQFGPAWDGPLPTAEARGLLFQGPHFALAGSNADDYQLTPGPATLTNNARQSAAIGVVTCYPDCNGDGNLNLGDFGCFQTKFALGDPYADCNGDGNLNLGDFGCFQTKFALGCQ